MGQVFSFLGFVFGKLLDLDEVIGCKEERLEPGQARKEGPVEALLKRVLSENPPDQRRYRALYLARAMPVIVLAWDRLGGFFYPDSPAEEITFPRAFLVFGCLLASFVLHHMRFIYPLIKNSGAARRKSFCLDKFYLIVSVFSGVVLCVGAPSSVGSFILCNPWGCIIDMTLDLQTPMNLTATFFSLAYAPLVPLALEKPNYWWFGLIPMFLFLFCSVFQLRYQGIVFPVG